jgi:hypothetical protein
MPAPWRFCSLTIVIARIVCLDGVCVCVERTRRPVPSQGPRKRRRMMVVVVVVVIAAAAARDLPQDFLDLLPSEASCFFYRAALPPLLPPCQTVPRQSPSSSSSSSGR